MIGPCTNSMSYFEYLNKSSRYEALKVRSFVNHLFGFYPINESTSLIKRLREKNDKVFLSAFSELIFYNILKRIASQIDIEPELPHTGKRPDFLVCLNDGNKTLIEVKTVFDPEFAGRWENPLINPILDAINEIPNSDLTLHVTIRGQPSRQLSAKSIKLKVEKWVNSLNYDVVHKSSKYPTFEIEAEGLHLSFEASCRETTRGRADVRLIGSCSPEGGRVTTKSRVFHSVAGKNKYGETNLPLIITVNSHGPCNDHDHAIDALFGSEAVAIWTDENGDCKDKWVRNIDGVFVNPAVDNTKISAVVYTTNLNPWSIAQRRLMLIPNPNAVYSVNWYNWPFDHIQIEGNRMFKRSGVSIGGVYGFASGLA